MTLDQINAETLRLQIRAVVAQDAFSARRAREEKLWCEHNGLSAPLDASRYRAMNRVVDFAMSRSKEAEELAAAIKALRENKWKTVDWRMIQCLAVGAIDELDRKMDELEVDPRLSDCDRAEQIDSFLSARAALDRLVSAIAEATKEVYK